MIIWYRKSAIAIYIYEQSTNLYKLMFCLTKDIISYLLIIYFHFKLHKKPKEKV